MFKAGDRIYNNIVSLVKNKDEDLKGNDAWELPKGWYVIDSIVKDNGNTYYTLVSEPNTEKYAGRFANTFNANVDKAIYSTNRFSKYKLTVWNKPEI